ncbi:MAG: class I SAM-dependent methyltransferase [Pseudonocardiales bacterium]
MSWQDAGVAWSYRAKDWAYLMEPLFAPVYDQLVTALAMGSGTQVLDVGCGSGLGVRRYQQAGAQVAGADAAQGLLAIASERAPGADLRHASLTELPWADASFDAVTGVNSFVYADDGGLTEAHRVLRPDGLLGIGFWRDPEDFGWAMQELGAALAPHVSEDDTHTPLRMSQPDSAKELLEAAGFDVIEGGDVRAVSEFPDVDVAYRALASTGMMYPVTEAGEEDALRERSLDILRSKQSDDSGTRMKATFGWLVARRG